MAKTEFKIFLKTDSEQLGAGTITLEGEYASLTPADAVSTVKRELVIDDDFIQFREHLIPRGDFRGLVAEVSCMWKEGS